jgi:hypothetical protein
LRRALKIKAYTLLLAWIVIFAHNVIPHNHSDEYTTCSHQIINCNDDRSNLAERTVTIQNRPAGDTVCHLSNLLFHSFNPENLFNCSLKKVDFIPCSHAEKIVITNSNSDYSENSPGISLFRAPPSA